MFRLGYLTRRASAANLHDTHFAVVDVETTGFDPKTDRVVEVAVTRMTGSATVLGTASTLVNPGFPIPPGASRVHRIRDTDAAGAPTFAEIAPGLLGLVEGAIVVAHNLVFDGAFLAAELTRAKVSVPILPALCTQVTALSQLMDTRVRLVSLTQLMLRRRLGQATHSAAVDSRCTAAILHQFLANAPEPLFYEGDVPTLPNSWAWRAPSSFRPVVGRQPHWPDTWWEEGNAGGVPRWHQHWQGRETAAQATLEWREAAQVPGIETISPAVVENNREEILTRRARQVQAMGRLTDYPPAQREQMVDRTLARIRSFGKLVPQRQAELRSAFTVRLTANGGDLAEAFEHIRDQAVEREPCLRDAKMHRVGSPCTTLDWADTQLLEYLRQRLADQEAAVPPYDELVKRIKAAIAACQKRLANSTTR